MYFFYPVGKIFIVLPLVVNVLTVAVEVILEETRWHQVEVPFYFVSVTLG